MELDNGSALSVISGKDYQAYFSHLKLQPTVMKLKTFISSKVDWSDQSTLVVPVVKGNSLVHICGDIKVSINLVLKAEQYPSMCVVDIFAALGQAKRL